MWLPEMCPSAYTVATTTVAKAREIMPRSAIVNGASPLTISVAGTEPTPMNTRNAVPMTSAASFWADVGSSMSNLPARMVESHSTCRTWYGKLRVVWRRDTRARSALS